MSGAKICDRAESVLRDNLQLGRVAFTLFFPTTQSHGGAGALRSVRSDRFRRPRHVLPIGEVRVQAGGRRQSLAVNFILGPERVVVDSPSGQEGLGGSQVRHGFEDVVGPLSQNFPFWES